MKKKKIMKVLLAIEHICHNQYKENGECYVTCPLYRSACFTTQQNYSDLEATADVIKERLNNEKKNEVND